MENNNNNNGPSSLLKSHSVFSDTRVEMEWERSHHDWLTCSQYSPQPSHGPRQSGTPVGVHTRVLDTRGRLVSTWTRSMFCKNRFP